LVRCIWHAFVSAPAEPHREPDLLVLRVELLVHLGLEEVGLVAYLSDVPEIDYEFQNTFPSSRIMCYF
jgi:hypothetical protein